MKNFIYSFIMVLALVSCSFEDSLNELEYEKATFVLPQWPRNLPPLVCWKVELYAPQNEYYFYAEYPAGKKDFCCRVKKNSPLYVCAFPVTGSARVHQRFFNCAGAVYPWQSTGINAKTELSWTGGYAASLAKTLINAAETSGYKGEYVSSYIASFNWLKLNQVLQEKQEEALEEQVFYNPWLLDSQKVLEGIAYESFTATKLKMSGVFALNLDFSVYSAYVPENQLCGPGRESEQGRISLQKNRCLLFALPSGEQSEGLCDYGLMIYGESEKKISLEFISMPIYIEGI